MYTFLLFFFCTLSVFSSYAEEERIRNEMIVSNTDESFPSLREIQKKNKKSRPAKLSVKPNCPAEEKCAEKKSCTKETSSCNDPFSHIQFGPSYRYVYVTPTGLSSLSGHMGGLNASYEYQRARSIYEGITFALRQGTAHGVRSKREILDIDTQGRIGYTFGRARDCWNLSLFTGLGYRHLGEKSTVSGATISYHYNDLYAPIGFFLKGAFGKYLYMGLHFQWKPPLYPTVALSSLKGSRFDTNYRFANVAVDLPISLILSRRHNLELILKPYFEYFQDGATNARSSNGTPLGVSKVTRKFSGFDLNLCYSF